MQQYSFALILAGLALLIGVVGFGTKSNFARNLKYALPAVLFASIIFVIWDYRFDEQGIWRYDADQLSGITMGRLAFEPILFHILLPLLGLAVYQWIRTKTLLPGKANLFLAISLVLLLVFAWLAYSNRQQLHTFFTFFLTTVYFGYTIFRNRFKRHYNSFYISFLLLLVPYIIVQVLLLGIPVLAYNPDHILGFFVLGIPVENFAALFLQLLMSVSVFEFLYERKLY